MRNIEKRARVFAREKGERLPRGFVLDTIANNGDELEVSFRADSPNETQRDFASGHYGNRYVSGYDDSSGLTERERAENERDRNYGRGGLRTRSTRRQFGYAQVTVHLPCNRSIRERYPLTDEK